MLDVFNIPNQSEDIKIFYAASGSNSWQTWYKPRKCSHIWMMCIGAGSGGSTPGILSAASAAAGGGSGAITRALFPAFTIPDILYVQPGFGGPGAAQSTSTALTNGSIGAPSYVSAVPSSSTAMNLVCASGTAAVTSTAVAAAATVGTANLLHFSVFQSIGGQSTTANGTAVTPFSSIMVSGGSPNVGSGAGANINATSISPVITGGALGGGNGANGIWSWKPMWGLGGAAGGYNGSGVGGAGGDGAFGCGGGCGGGGTTASGRGGKGGDGLIVIVAF